jgi:hypothetical protein
VGIPLSRMRIPEVKAVSQSVQVLCAKPDQISFEISDWLLVSLAPTTRLSCSESRSSLRLNIGISDACVVCFLQRLQNWRLINATIVK